VPKDEATKRKLLFLKKRRETEEGGDTRSLCVREGEKREERRERETLWEREEASSVFQGR
jgi:hypothetical protein